MLYRVRGASRAPFALRAIRGAIAALCCAAVAAPAFAADAAAGRKKAGACVACHGENGLSVQPNAPHLAGQPAAYLADQLRQYKSGRRANEVMSVVAKPLSETDIDDLAAWFASIDVEAKLPR